MNEAVFFSSSTTSTRMAGNVADALGGGNGGDDDGVKALADAAQKSHENASPAAGPS